MNKAEITRERLQTFIGMLARYGAVKIVITDDPKHDVWVVEWENGK